LKNKHEVHLNKKWRRENPVMCCCSPGAVTAPAWSRVCSVGAAV